MGFGEAVAACLSKFATFAGRASRPEYWWFYLFAVLVMIAAGVVDLYVLGYNPDNPMAVPVVSTIAVFLLLLPSLSVTVRRLHDTDRSGWWCFIGGVPVVGR